MAALRRANSQPSLPTASDRGPLINVSAWILLLVAVLPAIVKVLSKWRLARRMEPDDLYITAALLLTVGYTIALNEQVRYGLGQHRPTMSSSEVIYFGKAEYASQLLYVTSISLAKMAMLHFLQTLTQGPRRVLAKWIMAINAMFTVAALFAVVFQCSLPKPWETLSNACIDRAVFWEAFGVLDVIIDLATAALPIYMLYDLRIQKSKRIVAILAFMTRVILMPVIITRLVYVIQAYDTDDRPFDDYNIAIATSVHINFSVLTSCTPFLKPVMNNLQSGILAVDMRAQWLRTIREGEIPMSVAWYDKIIGDQGQNAIEETEMNSTVLENFDTQMFLDSRSAVRQALEREGHRATGRLNHATVMAPSTSQL